YGTGYSIIILFFFLTGSRGTKKYYYYLSYCYTIAWDRIYDQSSLCVFLLALSLARSLCVCICSHSKSRNYERILTKFGTVVDNRNGQDEFVSGENRKVVRGPFAHKTAQKRPEIGKSQPNIKG